MRWTVLVALWGCAPDGQAPRDVDDATPRNLDAIGATVDALRSRVDELEADATASADRIAEVERAIGIDPASPYQPADRGAVLLSLDAESPECEGHRGEDRRFKLGWDGVSIPPAVIVVSWNGFAWTTDPAEWKSPEADGKGPDGQPLGWGVVAPCPQVGSAEAVYLITL